MTDETFVIKEISDDGRIARLTFNRPEKKNAMNRAPLNEFYEELKDIRENTEARVLIIGAKGDSFSSGRDIKEMRTEMERRWDWDAGENMAAVVRLLRKCPQITIASVKGYCLGGALALVNACELAIAADTAKIGMPEILRGSYGATTTPTLFLSNLPTKIAFYIQLSGKNMSGEEAARLGLVTKVVPENELDSAVDELAQDIATRNKFALEHAKIAAYTQMDVGFDIALKTDDAIRYRMRYFTNPTSDVDKYLESQKGGTDTTYVKPEDRDP